MLPIPGMSLDTVFGHAFLLAKGLCDAFEALTNSGAETLPGSALEVSQADSMWKIGNRRK